MLRTFLSLAGVLLLTLAASVAARADEVFVLDNGMVLRGTAVGENANGVVIRLTDFVQDARVTVAPARIVKRYDMREGPVRPALAPPMQLATDAPGSTVEAPPSFVARTWDPVALDTAPLEEPSPRNEPFFSRLARLSSMALPVQQGSRILLGCLGLIALLALVLLGGRLLEIEGLGLLRGVAISGVFGLLVLANVLYSDALLRADRALWVLPLEAVSCLFLTCAVLRAGLGRAVLLIGFLCFSLSAVVFAAGAVLMAC
jgi:hypothetical protein